ncbi:hypothetical protein BDW02DRAFT_609658 [Decorospora gaudefroyi]|uniref:Protein kinase domain-containing protein n=1 Tax=Decorospora gaudefroyi TaxID=184978 RepID=A0A6A5K9J2_9PLEO|nr:hypothetical protein BDW02DRAFT_609658 [Decorospora gaudefroyi]
MPPEHTIPGCANKQFLPLQLIGKGKDGIVVLAVPRKGPQAINTCRAIKILDGDQIGTMGKKTLEELKCMQHKEDHLIAAVQEYPSINSVDWYCMDYIPGLNVEELLNDRYEDDGMPPTLIFHILLELMRVQQHLKDHDKCHIDLKEGGNIMLSAKEGSAWPSIKLVDFSGIWPYRESSVARHTIHLVGKMMNRERSVPQWWRLGYFDDSSLQSADGFYQEMWKCSEKEEEEQEIEELWEQQGEMVKRLKQDLRDEEALHDLKDTLRSTVITEENLQGLVDGGGMEMNVFRWDATCEVDMWDWIDEAKTETPDPFAFSLSELDHCVTG